MEMYDSSVIKQAVTLDFIGVSPDTMFLTTYSRYGTPFEAATLLLYKKKRADDRYPKPSNAPEIDNHGSTILKPRRSAE